ncbi:DUF3772 domain-containing protein [Paracoccus sp. Z118]|nr:DUF3772 domain-containing protein [Paracoccus sp. Z118]
MTLIRGAILACLTLLLVQLGAAPTGLAPLAPAQAQETSIAAPDYADWDQQASRIEELVDEGGVSDQRLSEMRSQVIEWRESFLAAQNINSGRIETVRGQINALGPAPAEGETEAEDVASRRAELNAILSELQAPGLRAIEAASRASGIVQAIDQIQRERQASALLALSPSPVLPSSWSAAATDAATLARGLGQETADRYGAISADEWRSRAPAIAGYLVAALLLLIYGWRWIDGLPRRLSATASEHSRDAVVFLASLGQIAIPTAGVYLAVRAADLTGLFGDWGRPLLMALPVAAFVLFAGRWLSGLFFPAQLPAPMEIPDAARASARINARLLSAVMAVHTILNRAIVPWDPQDDLPSGSIVPMQFSEAGAGVFHMPVIVLGAVLLFRLGVILRRVKDYDGSDQPSYAVRLTALAGTLARPIAIIVVVIGLIGYVSLANGIVWPTIRTIALLGLLILLQEFIVDLYGMMARDRNKGRQALAPVLIGFGLVLASLPVFALIWGARVSDLGEWWTRLRQGVSLGGVRLSPGAILTFLVVFAAGYGITRLVQGAFRTSILPKTRIDAGGQNAVVSGLGYVGIALAVVMAIGAAGIDMSSLAIVAGALSVGIGFGMQNVVSNFVSGIILLIERPITIGDWIRVGTSEGYVRRISVRSTQIQTFDRNNIIVPNSDLISQSVINWTKGSLQGRIIVPVNVAYGADTRRVTEILREIAEDQPIVLINPPPSVLFTGFANEGMTFEIRAVISDVNQGLGVATEIRHRIIESFLREGIVIPFTVRDFYDDDGAPLSQARAISGRRPEAGTGEGASGEEGDTKGPPGLDPRIAALASSGIEHTGGDDDGDANQS